MLALAWFAMALAASLTAIVAMGGPIGPVAEMLFLLFAALFVLAVLLGGRSTPRELRQTVRSGAARRGRAT